jgi:integrase
MERRTRQEEGFSESMSPVDHLSQEQLFRLTEAFKMWNESATSLYIRRVRGRYWLSFLFLRFSGARIGEILRIDDISDIDFADSHVRIVTPAPTSKTTLRVIPVPAELICMVGAYLAQFPSMRGRVFALDQGNFRREFYRRAQEAQIPRTLSHPHILRHTRAVEMLHAGVPLTIVQDLLGHVLRSTTALYLERSELAALQILKEKGLL